MNALLEDRMGTLWVGSGGGGLQKLNKGSRNFTHYRCDPKNANTLSSNAVYSLCEDSRGALWIGTGAGLNRFDLYSGSFTHFTEKNGLASDNIGGILEDDHGILWLGTGKGVSSLDPRTGSVRNYDAADGVRIQQCWGQSSFKSKTGEMYFGGINGFVRFHPDSMHDNPYVPPVVISAFKTFDRFVQLDTVVSEKSEVHLSFKENVFAFEFVALNYSSPEKNRYAYKLDGFDNDWTYCGTRRNATYTNLDGGDYVFRVKGSNNDGVWNETGVAIAVIITPPLWATWWFRGFAFIAILVSVGGIIRYFEMRKLKTHITRLEQERTLERERIRISQDLHDEVGASLSKIAIISELAIKNSGNIGGVTPQLQNISQLAGEVVDSVSAIVWAINPHNDKLDNLVGYMREYASDFFESTPIECRFDFPDELPAVSAFCRGSPDHLPGDEGGAEQRRKTFVCDGGADWFTVPKQRRLNYASKIMARASPVNAKYRTAMVSATCEHASRISMARLIFSPSRTTEHGSGSLCRQPEKYHFSGIVSAVGFA